MSSQILGTAVEDILLQGLELLHRLDQGDQCGDVVRLTHMAERVKGARVLAVATLGLRNIYSKKEIHKVEDLKGLKIRVQATKTEDTHFAAYGAQVVHMPFGDVYTSLQTGVVDAAETEDQAGIWLRAARMNLLRTPKALTGPELGVTAQIGRAHV